MEITLLIIATILSAFFSSTETVYLSASRIKIEILLRRNVKGIKKVYPFINKPESFIVTTLVGNNLANVVFSSIIVLLLKDVVDEVVIIIGSSLYILIFAEIIPKTIGREYSNNLIIINARILNFFKFIFYPINLLLIHFSNFIVNTFNVSKEDNVKLIFSRRDVIKTLNESQKKGVIKSKEGKLINRIFDLSKTRIRDPMVPRTDIVAVKKDTSLTDLIKQFNASGLSRIPVYNDTIDDIIGVVYAKDIFAYPEEIEDIIHDIMFVPETKYAYRLLQEFRRRNTSIAIVLDEYGGTAGLVTLEDLVEELVGEIYDEFDIDKKHMFRKQNAFTFVIDAKAEIDEVNEKFGISIPEKESYSTVGGYIIEKLGHIPVEGEVLELEQCKIVIYKASRKQVISVKLILKQKKHIKNTA